MAFHPHILEVKESLRRSDKRYETICKLTEPEDPIYLKDYEAMWKTLFKAEKEIENGFDNKWVIDFIDTVQLATNLPPYFYISNLERQELIKMINKHTRALIKIYRAQKLNQNLISNDGQFFGGFSTYDKNGNKKDGPPPKVSVVNTLKFFAERANEAIHESGYKGKGGKNAKAIRFIRMLGERNTERYGRPLNPVIKAASFILYKTEYEDYDIRNLLNRITKT